jgi:hypothetical protein
MNKYPIGAMWKAEDNKKTGLVWLEKIESGCEIWIAESFYSCDGSGKQIDWHSSKRKAIENCFVYGKFKRVKNKNI